MKCGKLSIFLKVGYTLVGNIDLSNFFLDLKYILNHFQVQGGVN